MKEIGRTMLKRKETNDKEEDASHVARSSYHKLSLGEIGNNQKKLARAIIMFMELLHVLVGRNRDLLLTALELRKRSGTSSAGSFSERGSNQMVPPSPGQLSATSNHHDRIFDDGSMGFGGASASSTMDRTDKAMAIQRELQKAFIAMNKILQPIILSTVHSECPRWMKMCCQDSYFSSGSYRQAKIGECDNIFFI